MQATIKNNENDILEANRLKGGLRLKRGTKYNQAGNPIITIITSTYNAAKDLPYTIKSWSTQKSFFGYSMR